MPSRWGALKSGESGRLRIGALSQVIERRAAFPAAPQGAVTPASKITHVPLASWGKLLRVAHRLHWLKWRRREQLPRARVVIFLVLLAFARLRCARSISSHGAQRVGASAWVEVFGMTYRRPRQAQLLVIARQRESTCRPSRHRLQRHKAAERLQ
jgi:hypothetical protein